MSLEVRTVSVPSLGAVKMEDRKRSVVSEQDDLAPPAKRQATNTANGAKAHAEADMPWKDDLENFQKDAIWRQMREYKRQVATCENNLAEVEKKVAHHDDHLRITDAWSLQLVDELKIMCGEAVSPRTESPNSVLFPSGLLFADSDKFQEHLSTRREAITTALSKLLAANGPASPDVEQLQSQLTKFLAQEKVHVAEQHKLLADKEQLEERLEKATLRYMNAERKFERAKSQAVQKIERQAKLGAGGAGTDESSNVKKETSHEPNGVSDAAPASDEMQAARKEAEAVAAKRKEQLDALEAENKKLLGEISEMKVKFSGLTDDDYAKSELFKAMKSVHEDVVRKLNDAVAQNTSLREEAQSLQGERTTYKTQVENETREATQNAEKELVKAEADLARIRTARDELLADQSVRKASMEQTRNTNEQMRELAESRDSRIAALESEIERLRIRLKDEAAPGSTTEGMDEAQLREKVATLERESALLSAELPSMEAAYRKSQALASKKVNELVSWEEQLARVHAEKAKADQKYFASMKAKEAREAECRAVKGQNAKSAEIISQLKDAENSSRAVVAGQEKQIVELKEQIHTITNQHRTLQQKMTEHAITSEGFVSQIAELKKIVHIKDASYTSTAQAKRDAEVKVEQLQVQLAESDKQVEEWKARSQGKQSDTEGQLRQMVLCTVCRKDWKDTCIKTCGHLFCKGCVDQRLSSRSRKCPGCGKSFGTNDIMKVHLT